MKGRTFTLRIDGTRHEFDLDKIAAALPVEPFSGRQLADVRDIGVWSTARPISLLTEAGLIRHAGDSTKTGHGGRMHLYQRVSNSGGSHAEESTRREAGLATSVGGPHAKALRRRPLAPLALRRRVRSVRLRELATRMPIGRFTVADFAAATGVESSRARYYLNRLVAAGYVSVLDEENTLPPSERAFVARPVKQLPALPKQVPLANLAASVPSRVFRTSQFASCTGLGWHRARHSLQRMRQEGIVQPVGAVEGWQPTRYLPAPDPDRELGSDRLTGRSEGSVDDK